ncbi:hypothetical protein GZ77_15150 [Endozoicomonas montiporae]|uniref:Uncharacterized protein n=2 Tax=Endozoicomonas montiporae TaxID=1027273 RepID=A0A081N5C0_9GAMM|nr:hypothetical protein [Endozoicomonas montiporae]AMO57473.1 hypothetical protein EZMO1_3487 [Endozoicomonas montiporae CL-33]KEQ13643.1 hypothetical protein GZ77_15150 [Endozoicomonas montiporae]
MKALNCTLLVLFVVLYGESVKAMQYFKVVVTKNDEIFTKYLFVLGMKSETTPTLSVSEVGRLSDNYQMSSNRFLYRRIEGNEQGDDAGEIVHFEGADTHLSNGEFLALAGWPVLHLRELIDADDFEFDEIFLPRYRFAQIGYNGVTGVIDRWWNYQINYIPSGVSSVTISHVARQITIDIYPLEHSTQDGYGVWSQSTLGFLTPVDDTVYATGFTREAQYGVSASWFRRCSGSTSGSSPSGTLLINGSDGRLQNNISRQRAIYWFTYFFSRCFFGAGRYQAMYGE